MGEVTKTGASMDTASRGLKKHNIKVSTAVFMVFSLVAAGCYGIESMIPEAGPGLTLVMLMVLPFVWGLPFGLVASELGSVRPQEGGYYKWVQEALGEFWGFQAGWWRTVSIYIDNALYVILAGGYFANQFNLSPTWEFGFKALMILIFMYINLRGVKDVGLITNILSIFVIIAFAMIAVIGFINWNQNPFEPFTAEPIEAPSDWIFYIGAGISIGMWMYSGYESMSTIAGELEDPQVIPKATLITVPLIMCTYIFPTMAGLASMGNWENWGEAAGDVGYATVAETYLGPAAGIFFVVVAVVAQCSIYNTYIASGSRGFFALAEDNLAPPLFVKVDKKYGVPYVAVISISVVSLILCNFAFTTIVIVDVFMLVASYVMVYISAMILRKRIPAEEYKFKIPGGYGVLCVICIVPMIVAFISFLINGTDYFIGGMIGIISGPILYFIWRKMYGGLTKKDPQLYPGNEKTGLAQGDTKRMGIMFGILAIIGVAGCAFLPWYEGDWAVGYMEEGEYVMGYYEETYEGMPFLSNWDAMLDAILIATIVCAVVAIICFAISGKVEKNPENKVEL